MAARNVWWVGVASLAFAGCLLDDEPCGRNQVKYDELFEACTCAPGAIPNAEGNGCHLCGVNEEAKGGQCVCLAGYRRPSPTAACALIEDAGASDAAVADAGASAEPTGQDQPCSTDADCASYDATFCQSLQAPNVCLVQSCATGERRCSTGRECCVITLLPQLAATNGLCIPIGTCSRGTVVTP